MNDNQKNIVFILIVLVALIAVGKLFKGIGKAADAAGTVSDNFGITQSNEAKDIKNLSAFLPTFYKKQKWKKGELPSGAKIAKAASIIQDAAGTLYSDDDAIIGALKQFKSQSEISFLSDVFQQTYKRDMLMSFYSNMTDRRLKDLYNYVIKLPVK